MNTISKEDILKSESLFNGARKCLTDVCPEPTKNFEINEKVQVGCLDNVVIKAILNEGKAYRTEYTHVERDKPATLKTAVFWWFDIKKDEPRNENKSVFKNALPGKSTTVDIDTLRDKMSGGGIVFNPIYQRDYVWTDENKFDLIDSIFNNISIGNIIMCKNHGYIHEDSDETIEYKNIDQKTIHIPKKDDYTIAIIDGQQRVTTLWQFITNQFAYENKFWDDLSFTDQRKFEDTVINARVVNEDELNQREMLQMFLKVNKGVPQDQGHLQKIENMIKKIDEKDDSLNNYLNNEVNKKTTKSPLKPRKN
jgi:hypothetical protein